MADLMRYGRAGGDGKERQRAFILPPTAGGLFLRRLHDSFTLRMGYICINHAVIQQHLHDSSMPLCLLLMHVGLQRPGENGSTQCRMSDPDMCSACINRHDTAARVLPKTSRCGNRITFADTIESSLGLPGLRLEDCQVACSQQHI